MTKASVQTKAKQAASAFIREAREAGWQRAKFEIKPDGGGFDVTHLADAAANAQGSPKIGSPAPLLDPPPGVRAGWLDDVLPKYSFVVLVFYRGFW